MVQEIKFTFQLVELPRVDVSLSEIHHEATFSVLFRSIIKDVLQKYLPQLDLSEIGLLTQDSDILTAEDLNKTVEDIFYEFGVSFQITLRSSINGPDLSLSPSKMEGEISEPKAPISPKPSQSPPSAKINQQPSPSPLPPSTETPPPSVPRAPSVPPPPSYSPIAEKSKKKKGAALKRAKSAVKEDILESVLLDEEVAELSPSEVSMEKETETFPEVKKFEKSCALDYFDVMNPEKYYPLHLLISDTAQKSEGPTENLLTGERITKKVENLAFEVESSLIKVRPVFPGCSVVPQEIITDLQYPEDGITFYITPLVKSKIEDSRIEFIDYKENLIGKIDCPCEVKDPRYSRVVALYGILASSVPKILTLFGFDYLNELELTNVLPFLVNIFNTLSLGNFVAIAGIILSLIISIIIYYKRGDKSTKKEFQLGDLRENLRSRSRVKK